MPKEKELLIELRSQLVGKLHTQPFTIYTDSTIDELLKARPKTLEELASVKGFPADGKRIKGFGEAIIEIFKNTNRIEKIEITGDSSNVSVGTVLSPMNAF
jgi:ribonuclease D